MLKDDVNKQLELIEQSLSWAKKYNKDSFPVEEFKRQRRELKKIKFALSERCAAAAYGESQVGKSYLMSSLLSSPNQPFEIPDGDGHKYTFIYDINPSGGANSKNESTGVITRFTTVRENNDMEKFVKIRNLTVTDLILVLVDTYRSDLIISTESDLTIENINQQLEDLDVLTKYDTPQQSYITEDDIYTIQEYLKNNLNSSVTNCVQSRFLEEVAPRIQYVGINDWVYVFQLLWNNNSNINELFKTLIAAYSKLKFSETIYVPFDAVLSKYGTLLHVTWLDAIFDKTNINNEYKQEVDIYDGNKNLICTNFSKALLSAIMAEVTFVLSPDIVKDRSFLNNIDLLDFPGARSRKKIREENAKAGLTTLLRRGRVAYLFNKYSAFKRINAVLFCHHNDQPTEDMSGIINAWIIKTIGQTSKERAEKLKETNSLSPFFFICTKFNIDMQLSHDDRDGNLSNHWSRFERTIPEVLGSYTWFDDWTAQSGMGKKCFTNTFLLRDFYFSQRNNVFDGYSDGDVKSEETDIHEHPEFPNFLSCLKASFKKHDFTKKHFDDNEQAWNDVATLNNDGSKAIIAKLDAISELLDTARHNIYEHDAKMLCEDLVSKLAIYHESDDITVKNDKVKRVVSDIRYELDMKIGNNPELFGHILDKLMISPIKIREIAHDILVRHKEKPVQFDAINMLRHQADININRPREENIAKLCDYYGCTCDEIKQKLQNDGLSLDDIVSSTPNVCLTDADVLTKQIIEYWNQHIYSMLNEIKDVVPHAAEVAFMLTALFKELKFKETINKKITSFVDKYPVDSALNVIADAIAQELNCFVSNIGYECTEYDLEEYKTKAQQCNIRIKDLNLGTQRENISIEDALDTLEHYSDIMKQKSNDCGNIQALPLLNSYGRWDLLVSLGLIAVSEVSRCNPEENNAIGEIIDNCNILYQYQ